MNDERIRELAREPGNEGRVILEALRAGRLSLGREVRIYDPFVPAKALRARMIWRAQSGQTRGVSAFTGMFNMLEQIDGRLDFHTEQFFRLPQLARTPRFEIPATILRVEDPDTVSTNYAQARAEVGYDRRHLVDRAREIEQSYLRRPRRSGPKRGRPSAP